MTTCKTCKHWTEVAVAKPEWAQGRCGRVVVEDYPTARDPMAIYTVDWAQLLTRPDFGCTLHEARHD